MSIKKIASSLYLSLFLRMLGSALACTALFALLAGASTYYVEHQNDAFLKEESVEIEKVLEEIKAVIIYHDLTFDEVNSYNFTTENIVHEIDFSDYSITCYHSLAELNNDDLFNNSSFFQVSFSDINGYLVIKANYIQATATVLYLASGVVCIALFFVLSVYLVFKQLSYLKTIEEGVGRIAHEDLDHKIPLKGNNELTHLAQRINAMGITLSDNKVKEHENELARRLLITNMSHDLRTPLTSINGYISLAKDKTEPDNETFSYLSTAQKNGRRLETLIEDLFLYSKLISKDVAIDLQTMNINLVVKQIAEIQLADITLIEKNNNLTAKIDPDKFHRALDNLLGNATKYGQEGEPVVLTIYAERNNVVVLIQNKTDKHFDQNLNILTSRCYTAHNEGAYNSSGLGLSIVEEILKTMNGSLDLSFEDKTFNARIILPSV